MASDVHPSAKLFCWKSVLHAADVGISVSTGVDVARDAADILLLEQSLQVLHNGILEGRKAFGNVIKYLLMGTSSNFGNMFSMAGAYVFLPFLPMLPSQILLNNFLALYFLFLVAMTVVYLLLVEVVKRRLMRRMLQ